MRKFDVGVVGAGTIARTMHLPVLTRMGSVRVRWIADADPGRAAALGRAFGLPSHPSPADPGSLPPADVVLLAIPVAFREPYLHALAGSGAAVMAEKPFARDAEEHDRLTALFPPHRLGCGLQRRTFASSRLIRRAVAEKAFGALRRVVVSEGARQTRTMADATFLDDARAGGGVLLDLGCHALDLVLHVSGAARASVRGARIVWDGEVDRRVEASVSLETPSGTVPFDFTVSWLDAQENRYLWEFEGATLAVGIPAGAPVEVLCGSDRRGLASLRPPAGGAETTNQAFFLEWLWFLEGLEEGRTSEMAAVTARATTVAMEEIYRVGRRP